MCTTKVRLRSTLIRQHLIDLLEDHPFEIGLSLALVLFGARSLISGLQAAPGSVQTLPIGLAVAYCVLSVLGGSAVLFGLVARYRYVWAYGIERFGLFVSASAWFSYIVGIVMSPTPISGKSTLMILALLALSIGCLLRARAINRNARATLIALRQANRGKRKEQ